MKAVTVNEFGTPPAVRDDLPAPTPSPGDVLVRVRASSANPVDNAIAGGMLSGMVEHEFPVTLGRDYAGVVEQVGADVTGYAVGDEVYGFVPHANPTVHDGAWAELITVPQSGHVGSAPAGVELAIAGAAPLAGITALTAIDALALSPGDIVLIVGATGGVGSLAAHLAAAAGATVIAPALPEDEEYLRALGVSAVLPRDGDSVAAARERHPDGVDAVLDLVSYTPRGLRRRAQGRWTPRFLQRGSGRGTRPDQPHGRPPPGEARTTRQPAGRRHSSRPDPACLRPGPSPRCARRAQQHPCPGQAGHPRRLNDMELGVISLSDLQADPATGRPVAAVDRLDDTVAYARLADRLGVDVFALGEHHSPDFAVSSPAVVLAAIAGQTGRIRLTSGVTVLSALDPVPVYQDFAQLDLLSHGRAEITAGRSAFAEPFALFGAPIDEYDRLFAEKLDLLLRVREQERVTWSGRYRPQLIDAPITRRAVQDPLPVWIGVGGSPQSAARAGYLGLPMVLGYIGGTLAHARHAVDIYHAAGEAAGHPEKLRVDISTHFYAAASEHDADDVFPHYREYLRPKTPGGRGFHVDQRTFTAGRGPDRALMIGPVDQLIEKIIDAHTQLGITRFFGQIDGGGLPRERVEDSITRLANQIAPAVREVASAAAA